MANIQNVDYNAIPALAQSMRASGQALNAEITTAYKSIEDMHTSWYGQRYNELLKDFNEMIPKINVLLRLVVGEIPLALERIANNYSRSDTGATVTAETETDPKVIEEIAIPSDVGMRFITEEVSAVQTSVTANLNNAVDQMNQIQSTFTQISWESEAASAFETKFTKIKGDVIASFDNISAAFTKLMTQTQEDIQGAESANTVG